MKYKITNRTNQREFIVDTEFIDGDIDTWVLQKVKAYGDDPIVDIIESDSEVYQRKIGVHVDMLWKACSDYVANNAFDGLGASRIVVWINEKPENLALQAAIAACLEWTDAVWFDYYKRKKLVTVDEEPNCDYSNHGLPPYSFSQIAELASGVA